MKLSKRIPIGVACVLLLNGLLASSTVQAAVVAVQIDCPDGPAGTPRVTPEIVDVSAGDIVEWSIDVSCAGGACGSVFYEIVIDPCPPLFTLGYNTGHRSMTQPIASPVAEANAGLCKYTVNIYNGSGDLCTTLDPYIHGQPRVPAAGPRGLGLLALALAAGAVWILRKRIAAHRGEAA